MTMIVVNPIRVLQIQRFGSAYLYHIAWFLVVYHYLKVSLHDLHMNASSLLDGAVVPYVVRSVFGTKF